MARVRYIVDDVDDAVSFYASKLGFEVEQQNFNDKMPLNDNMYAVLRKTS